MFQDEDEEIIVKSKGSCSLLPDTTSLSLENCTKVTVIKDALQDVRALHNLEFINVGELSIQGRLFPSDGPARNVLFKNSTIPDVPSFAFSGNVDSVLFDNCHVGAIRAFAFSNINGADRVVFREANVSYVEAQAFKKFPLNKLLIVDSHFNVIPSRFVLDVTVEHLFKIESTYIGEIQTSGFKIFNPRKVVVVNSMINKLHEEAFKIVTRGEVVIEDNVLNSIENEAFRSVSVDKHVIVQNGRQKFKFKNQTVTHLREKSLYINRSVFEVHIGQLMVDEACTCDGIVFWKDVITRGKTTENAIEIELEPIWCHMDDQTDGYLEYVSARGFFSNHCTKLTTSIYFFVIIITATAVGVLLAIAIGVCILRRRRKWKPVPLSGRNLHQKDPRNVREKRKDKKKQAGGDKPGATKAIIVPDGRTYKETEFHIIVEKAEPLDEECLPCTVVRDRSHSQLNQQNRA